MTPGTRLTHGRQAFMCLGAVSLLTFGAGFGHMDRAHAADLPVPCVAGTCGAGGPATWVTSGRATATTTGNVLRVDQQTERAILNWQSFDVGANSSVVFRQPNASSIALNRIFQANPSRILGLVQANGQIYLINPNGMIFGKGAKVSAAGILASTLDMDDSTFTNGLVSPDLLLNGKPALRSDGRVGIIGADGQPVLDPDGKPLQVQLIVDEGAAIASNVEGGRVLLAGQSVSNAGQLSAPDGQVIVAAGEKVYLQASADSNLRGLLVEVDVGGKAWNQLAGSIDAARGNATMVGLAVNQDGRISASTSTSANGSVRLLARDSVEVRLEDGVRRFQSTRAGQLELGSGSTTEVLPDATDKSTAVNDQPQPRSTIELQGHQVSIRQGANILAPSGLLSVSALANPANPLQEGAQDADARLRIETGTNIDLSGRTAIVPMSRNLVRVELRANELRDSPVQRDGPLRGQTVYVDARVGTPLADVSGAIAAIPRGIDERLSSGGEVRLSSLGDIVVAAGARIDVSGGGTQYQAGVLQTSSVITSDGRIVPIGSADPSVPYIGVLNPEYQVTYDRWGVIQYVPVAGLGGIQETTYFQGSSAGRVEFVAPAMSLSGTLLGRSSAGPYQRDPSSRPAGGSLVIGAPSTLAATRDYRAPSITFSSAPASIAIDDEASLPGNVTAAIPIDYLTNGGFTRTEIYSNGVVRLPDGLPLDLLPGSTFRVNAHRIDLGSDIRGLGAILAFNSDLTFGIAQTTLPTAGIYLGSGTTLNVSGGWINESVLGVGVNTVDPRFVDAGSIALSLNTPGIASELQLADGVSLLANGGAYIDAASRVRGGKGGNVSLVARNAGSILTVGEDVNLAGYGVQGAAGGKFTLETARLDIVESAGPWIEPGSIAHAIESESRALIGSNLFTDYGFAAFDLIASGPVNSVEGAAQPALQVAADASIDLRTSTLAITPGDLFRPTGGEVTDFVAATLLELDDRRPVSLALRVRPVDVLSAADVGALVMSDGATIDADPLSTVTFESTLGLYVGGRVTTPGGTIALRQIAAADRIDAGFDPNLRIEVGPGAVLDASGIAILEAPQAERLVGRVLAGGGITLTAQRGSIVTRPGSLLDVSGTQAALDLQTGEAANPYRRQNVGSAGGSIQVTAPETFVLAGDIQAFAGVGETGQAPAGTLTLVATRREGFSPGEDPESFPTTPKVIRLVDVAPGGAPPVESGLSLISRQAVDASGIDALQLRADDRVEIETGIDLQLERSLTLNAPVIAVVGAGESSLGASYVSLGTTSGIYSSVVPAAGDSVLNMRGDLIDLVGSTVVAGTSRVALTSSGDIRFIGDELGAVPVGSFAAAGDIDLAAARIYAATLTDFNVRAYGTGSRLRTFQNGASTGVPLSAVSSITLRADTIEHGGSLYAPFGVIDLAATDSIRLEAGSVLSVSADGSLIPYGNVENGERWIYSVQESLPLELVATPERRVTLTAADVELGAGSTVDLRGGGDLYAYEWLPGTGGSTDALSGTASPGLYAVLPSLRNQFAPYDPQESPGSGLTAGASIELTAAAGGLAAGVYPLLPARYALLPGAFLVSAVSGTTDTVPGTTGSLTDGTAVVSGRMTFGNTGLGATRYQGYSVRPGSYGRELANYIDYYASTYLPQYAVDRDLPVPVLPADAGTLVLSARNAIDAVGDVLASAAGTGRGATVALSASRLTVTGSGSVGGIDGVQISAERLRLWDPDRLILGATPVEDDEKSLEVVAGSIEIASGVDLAFDEVLLLATESINLSAGARIATPSRAVGAAPLSPDGRALRLTGSGADSAAFVAVSNQALLLPQRPGEAAPGTTPGHVAINAGATLRSAGAITIDAPGRVDVSGTVQGDGAAWALGSGRVLLGADSSTEGLALAPALVAAMNEAATMRLSSQSTIDVLSPVRLGVDGNSDTPVWSQLELVATGIRNLTGAATEPVVIAGADIVLRGTGDPAATSGDPLVPTGSLELRSGTIDTAGAGFAVEGFADTRVVATVRIQGNDEAVLATTGNLQLTSPLLTAGSGSLARFAAAGNLAFDTMAATGTAHTLPPGGGIELSGNAVRLDGAIVARSGLISIQSDSSIELGSNARLDASAAELLVAGNPLAADGGSIVLDAGTDVVAAQGSRFTVAGARDSSAGGIAIVAGGRVALASAWDASTTAPSALGGRFELASGRLDDFDGLNTALQVAGFTEQRSFRVATGDLDLLAGRRIDAREVTLVADSGRVQVAGTINASGDAAGRGRVRLYGATGVEIGASGEVAADAAAGFGRGGTIELGTSLGAIAVRDGASLHARGTATDGLLVVRAPRVGSDIAVDQLQVDYSDFSQIVLEPVMQYDVGAAPTDADLAAIQAETANYVATAAPVIRARLGLPDSDTVRIQPGVELRRDGALTLNALALEGWRFDGAPVSLSIRASDGVTLNGSITDGLQEATAINGRTYLEQLPGASATIRIASGADLLSADPLALERGALADLVLAPQADVRTGTGNIEIAVAGDLRFESIAGQNLSSGSIYTVGQLGRAADVPRIGPVLTYPVGGGDVRVSARGSVTGASVTQSVTDWQGRLGNATAAIAGSRWGLDPGVFGWNVGAVGGDVVVNAGRSITNLSAAATDVGYQQLDGSFVRPGGGALRMQAGGDIGSAMLYVADGSGRIAAGGGLVSTRESTFGEALGTLVMLGDAQVSIAARRDVDLETFLEPGAVRVPSAQRQVFFIRYDENSTARVRSAGGSVGVKALASRLSDFLGADIITRDPSDVFTLAPPSLDIGALAGDIVLSNRLTLYPTDSGQLRLLASRDVRGDSGFGIFTISDADQETLPTPARPVGGMGAVIEQITRAAASSRHVNDVDPVLVAAGNDLLNLLLYTPKATELFAGRDIRNVSLVAQNLRDGDVSSLQAGRDLVFERGITNGRITLGGPGRLDVQVGRQLDLGFSEGVATIGRFNNATIPSASGASITMIAGASAGLDADGFVDKVIAPSADYQAELIKYVEATSGGSGLTFAQARAEFVTYDPVLQRPLLTNVFFAELRTSGRDANTDPDAGFTRGYTAIDALFPGSRPGEGDPASPYAGDLTMPFSRIYTLAGGDISMYVPGGLLNVGLANPPTGLGVSREPSQLGIVTQRDGDVNVFTNGDVLVNQSRIFTLLGGNILVWSTTGDIDAGRGAKTAISAPPPTVVVSPTGEVTVDFSSAVAGSGIRTIITGDVVEPGDVDLIAPEGFVNAGDAGIGSAGNLNVAAQTVVGLDNIQVGGASTGVPAETSGLGASLSGVSNVSSGAAQAGESAVEGGADAADKEALLGDAALSWLDVFVVGFGAESCDPKDMDCIRRQKQ